MDIGIRLSSPKPGTIPDMAAPASGCIDLNREPCPKGAASSQSRLHVVMLHTVRWDERWAKGEKHCSNANKNKLRQKAKRLISEGKKLQGKLVRYDHRGKTAA
jgi:hypothetical protein